MDGVRRIRVGIVGVPNKIVVTHEIDDRVQTGLVRVRRDHALAQDVLARFHRQAGAQNEASPMGVIVHARQPELNPAGVGLQDAKP